MRLPLELVNLYPLIHLHLHANKRAVPRPSSYTDGLECKLKFAGIESTRASGIARLLPLQTYVSGVGSLHR